MDGIEIFLPMFFLIFNGTNEAKVLDSQFSWIRGYWMSYRGPGFLAALDLVPRPPPSLTHTCHASDTQKGWERETTCSREGGDGLGKEWIIIRPQGILVLYKSFNTLWAGSSPTHPHPQPLKGVFKATGGEKGLIKQTHQDDPWVSGN